MATVQGTGGVDEGCWRQDRGRGHQREWREYPKKTDRWQGDEYFASSPIQSWSQFGTGLLSFFSENVSLVIMSLVPGRFCHSSLSSFPLFPLLTHATVPRPDLTVVNYNEGFSVERKGTFLDRLRGLGNY
jgi:hypothetical protein